MADDKRKYDASTVFNANFQVGKAAPLDNRDVVRRYAHLVDGIGLNHYMGQVVYVTGEYDATKDTDSPETVDGIVVSEVGYYYFKNETDGWVKLLTIVDGGSGGGTEIPVDVLPVGEPNGIAPLDGNAKVPSQYLPSYVDDVIEGYYYNDAFYEDSAHTELITGETGKIYVDLSTDKTYRYSGSVYFEISNTQISNTFTTNIAVGGIPVGTQITSSMSIEDVIKKILVNVYQPRVTTNASASIAKGTGSAADVIKIGTKSISYIWSISGDRGTVKRSNGTSDETLGSYAGAMSEFKLYHTANSIDTALKSILSSTSPQTVTLSVNSTGYFQIDNTDIEVGGNTVSTSTEQTLSFKGGVTFENGTKYPDSTGAESTLAAFVGQELKSGSKSIEIVCPVFANTNSSTPTVSVEQTDPTSKTVLKNYSGFDVNNPNNGNHGLALMLQKHKLVKSGGTIDWNNSAPYTIEIPNSWTLYKVFWYNSNAKVWEEQTSLFDVKETANKTVNGVTVSYKTYYYTVESGNIDQNKFVLFIS